MQSPILVQSEVGKLHKVEETAEGGGFARIAVALELQDRYAEAESWTAKAINLFSRIHTPDAAQQVVNLRYYQSQLHSRAVL